MDKLSTLSLRAAILGLLMAIGLSACGSDKTTNTVSTAGFGLIKQVSQKLRLGSGKGSSSDKATAPDPNVLISQALAATPGPIALVVRLDTKATSIMNPVGTNGGYVTWKTPAKQGLTFKRGVLTNTRGLGDDLMSSRIDAAISAITARRATSYKREHYYLGGLGQSSRLVLNCTLSRLKSERVQIGEINAAATVMQENCTRGGLKFANLYWVDARGRVLKSSQWVGPEIGSLAIQNLRL